jgi:hypothetical protein
MPCVGLVPASGLTDFNLAPVALLCSPICLIISLQVSAPKFDKYKLSAKLFDGDEYRVEFQYVANILGDFVFATLQQYGTSHGY